MAAEGAKRPGELAGIQALRGFAALTVVMDHANQMVSAQFGHETFAWGMFGVDIFFVISGFVMVYAVERRPDITPWLFLRDRLLRIVPLYWTLTLLIAAAVWFRPSLFDAAVFDSALIVRSLLFIPQWHPGFDYDIVRPILIPGWTLEYEMYFYLLLAPLILLPVVTRILSVALLLAAAFLLGRSGLIGDTAAASFLGNPIVLEFVLGMLAAYAFLRGARVTWPRTVAIAAFAVLLLLAAPEHRFVSAGLPALILVLAAASIETIRSPIVAKTLRVVGDSSYSLYLSHLFTIGVINLLWKSIFPWPPSGDPVFAVAYFLTALLGSAVAGVLLYRLVERPLTRALKGRPAADSPPLPDVARG